MNDTTSSSTNSETQENQTPNNNQPPILDHGRLNWILDRIARLRVGHEGVMLNDAAHVLSQQRHVVDSHHQNTGVTQGPSPKPDDMIIGDVNVTYNSQVAPKASEVKPQVQQPMYQPAPAYTPPPATASKLSGWQKAAYAGALVAGLGAGVGLPVAVYQGLQNRPVVQDSAPAEDQDTFLEVGIYRDEK